MTETPQLSGPGRLILVVGPSGSGKDTIIAGAKAACAANPLVVFPRRVVTRAASASEDHDTLDNVAFDRAVKDGGFAFWWQAHGLKYGIPSSVDHDIRAGRTVICNVSRGIIADVRGKYPHVDVVLVTAPAEVLAARLSGRSRPSDGSLQERLSRNEAFQGLTADHVIENSGAPATAIEAFLKILERSPRARFAGSGSAS